MSFFLKFASEAGKSRDNHLNNMALFSPFLPGHLLISGQELRWNMIGELLRRLGSGKRERPEMKNDFWLIKHSNVFLTKFFAEKECIWS